MLHISRKTARLGLRTSKSFLLWASVIEALEPRTLLAAYSITDLGTLGGNETLPGAFAGSLITGQSQLSDQHGLSYHAFRWSAGQLTDLGSLGDGTLPGSGVAINSKGDVVGYTKYAGPLGIDAPTLFALGQPVATLDQLLPAGSPWTFVQADDINENGVILASAMDAATYPEGYRHLVLFDPATKVVTDLGKFATTNEYPSKMNAAGQIVVTRSAPGSPRQAFLISGGQTIEMGTLGGLYANAVDINAAGDVVGTSDVVTANRGTFHHAFVFHAGKMADIGDPLGFDNVDAAAMNDAGDIVGTVSTSIYHSNPQPFLYHAGKFTLLANLIPVNSGFNLLDVADINNQGQILARGLGTDNLSRALLLTPSTSSGPDDSPPQAAVVSAPDVTVGGATSYTFTVHFFDDSGIQSISPGVISLQSQYGYSPADLTMTSQVNDADGHGLVATYRFTARGGTWNSTDNMSFTIIFNGSDLTDTAGHHGALDNTPVGTFTVHIPSNTHEFAGAIDNAMAQSADQTLHLAFYDSSDHLLKYATRSAGGVWSNVSIIDSSPGSGKFVSMALDAQGAPSVAYMDEAHADLKFAHLQNGAWQIIVIDQRRCTGQYPSLTYDHAGLPAIAYWRKTSADLRIASFDGVQWSRVAIDTDGNVGRFPSLKVDPASNRLAVAYEDHSDGAFNYASENADGSWQIQQVDQPGEGGGFVSLAFSPVTLLPAFSYYDAGHGDLRFARQEASGAWSVAHTGELGTIGLYTNLLYTSSGDTRIYSFERSGNILHGQAYDYQGRLFLHASEWSSNDGGGMMSALQTGGSGDCTLAYLNFDQNALHVEEKYLWG